MDAPLPDEASAIRPVPPRLVRSAVSMRLVHASARNLQLKWPQKWLAVLARSRSVTGMTTHQLGEPQASPLHNQEDPDVGFNTGPAPLDGRSSETRRPAGRGPRHWLILASATAVAFLCGVAVSRAPAPSTGKAASAQSQQHKRGGTARRTAGRKHRRRTTARHGTVPQARMRRTAAPERLGPRAPAASPERSEEPSSPAPEPPARGGQFSP
jgi:hypothetical protein